MTNRRSSGFARYGTPQYLLWVHPALNGGLTDVTVEIYDSSDTLLKTLDATAAITAGCYSTDLKWQSPTPGTYRLRWQSATGPIDESWFLICASYPYGDADIDTPQGRMHHFTASGYVGAELLIYDIAGATTEDLDAAEYGTSASYHAEEFLLEEEGQYVFHWKSSEVAPVEEDVRILYFGPAGGSRTCVVSVLDTASSPSTPMPGVEVLVTLSDWSPVDQTATDSSGLFSMALTEGTDYIISLKKSGKVFTSNNFEITPGDPDVEGVNTFQLLTKTVPDSFSAIPILSAATDLSKMTVNVVDITGSPLRGIGILLNNTYTVSTATIDSVVYGILGGDHIVRTNANGYAEVYLVRGAEIEVTIEGTPVRRIFTVPDSDTFSLMSVVTGSNDPFTIVEPNVPSAPRSTL